MNALEQDIMAIIRADGAISIARFMELALQHPEHGYYRTHNPLGKDGDFTTAPEISQMFGELIGLWLVDCWQKMGRPDPFVLLELGPGRGTLMADALRATARVSGFHAALQLFLLDSNATLQAKQLAVLGEYHPIHISYLDEIPKLPLLVVANEFFDALPIRQFVKQPQGWSERIVGLHDDRLVFTLSPPDPAILLLIPESLHEALENFVYEISPIGIATMQQLASLIHAQTGAGLVFDYGYATPSGQGTLQAVARHASVPILDNVGQQDLTAHVHFGLLKLAAEKAGLKCFGAVGQGDFLQAMGIEIRAAHLQRSATPEQEAAITSALHRLTHPDEMGVLFKALAFASPPLTEVAGFS